jgi:two-component system phosphate regulon sensor histidine kinase PhoR
MISLRARLALPILLAAVILAVVVDLLVLAAVRREFVNDLRLRLERQSSLLSSVRLSPGDEPQLRGVAIVALRPDGTARLPFNPWEPSAWTALEAGGRIPDASEFLHTPVVGVRLDRVPRSWQGIIQSDEQAAVIISASSTAHAFEEIRVRLILSTAGLILGILAVTWVVGTRIGSRIRSLTRQITVLVDDDSAALARTRMVDELSSLSMELEHAHATLVKTRDSIERLQKMRSEFLANVSHEVRTPLFALKGYLETLLDGGIEDARVNRSFVEKAQKHAQRLDALLKDLIEISRIETGEMKMSFRYFRLKDLLQPAYEAYLDTAQQKQQSLELDYPELEVLGDRDRLAQVMSNLIENAIAYSPPGSHISIVATEGEKTVRISVADNGPGIPLEHQGRIFERFYRVDPDRSREAGGTGLGLAIAKHIVEAHGAKIMLQSRIGVGSTFSFEVPKGS